MREHTGATMLVRRLGILWIVGGIALGLAGPAWAAEIVIGVIAPLTGSKAEQGMQFKEGAELAVADINKGGGGNSQEGSSRCWLSGEPCDLLLPAGRRFVLSPGEADLSLPPAQGWSQGWCTQRHRW